MSKTKRVGGVDLSPDCFCYAGSLDDTKTWLFPILVRSNETLTVNLIKNGIARFDVTKGLPDSERANVWYALFGAARSHSIPIERREFPAVEVPMAEIKAVELNEVDPVLTDAEISAIIADADRRADAVLRVLGLE